MTLRGLGVNTKGIRGGWQLLIAKEDRASLSPRNISNSMLKAFLPSESKSLQEGSSTRILLIK